MSVLAVISFSFRLWKTTCSCLCSFFPGVHHVSTTWLTSSVNWLAVQISLSFWMLQAPYLIMIQFRKKTKAVLQSCSTSLENALQMKCIMPAKMLRLHQVMLRHWGCCVGRTSRTAMLPTGLSTCLIRIMDKLLSALFLSFQTLLSMEWILWTMLPKAVMSLWMIQQDHAAVKTVQLFVVQNLSPLHYLLLGFYLVWMLCISSCGSLTWGFYSYFLL